MQDKYRDFYQDSFATGLIIKNCHNNAKAVNNKRQQQICKSVPHGYLQFL